ncbi:MAG: hypothetical protein KDJ47_17010 [Hyphomicrobiaceae bacterium]|nr:hypothetical protein [Hyphomicrobiaceae bacterium]
MDLERQLAIERRQASTCCNSDETSWQYRSVEPQRPTLQGQKNCHYSAPAVRKRSGLFKVLFRILRRLSFRDWRRRNDFASHNELAKQHTTKWPLSHHE